MNGCKRGYRLTGMSYRTGYLSRHRLETVSVLSLLIAAAAIMAVSGNSVAATELQRAETVQPDRQIAVSDWKPPATPEIKVVPPVGSKQAEAILEEWGVQLLSLRLSAAGYMMDLRFRVLDVDKALPLFDQRIKPFIKIEKSGIRMPVPQAAKIGAFRATNRGKNIKADRNYFMMFANPDRHAKTGDKVSLVIGDFKAEGLTIN